MPPDVLDWRYPFRMVFHDVLRVLAVLAGAGIVIMTLRSAIQTFILPRGVREFTAKTVFLTVRAAFDLVAHRADSYEGRDRIMALYGPVALTALTGTWLVLVITGYSLVYWGIGAPSGGGSLADSVLLSGSSLFTLGFIAVSSVGYAVLVFSEAGIGLLLAALLVSYLPVIYGAWSLRERQVASLQVRAGSPPAAWNIIMRYHRIEGIDADELWPAWEEWFIAIEESHTSLSSLVFFRSPQPDRSWVNAAGVVLDAAALYSSAVDVPRNPRRELCLRAGYIALRRIATLFRIPFDPDPAPDAPISVTREEFDEVWLMLSDAGVPLKPDIDEAWKNFAGWRVNYDVVLLRLAALTMAPYAPWISDRSVRWQHPAIKLARRIGRRARGQGKG
jgi:hypothetical protein